MFKLRNILMAMMTAGALLSLSAAASAQLPQSVVQQLTPKYQFGGPNFVCRDPWITIAINERYGGTGKIQGIGDYGECNQYRYNNGSWSTYAELYRAVNTAFNNQAAAGLIITKQNLANGTVKITTSLAGRPDFTANQIISHDGGTLITSDGAGITMKQGSNILTNNGGTFISDNGSAARSLLSVNGDEASVNLGRSILLFHKGGGYSPATGNSTSGTSSNSTPPTNSSGNRSLTGSDDQILICISNRSAVQMIKRAGGLSYSVTSGTVYYSGSVANQFYKDQLVDTAKSCSAKAVNTDRLRVGR